MINIETLKQKLIDQNIIDEDVFEKARVEADRRDITVDEVLLEQGVIDELKLGVVLADLYGVEFINLREKVLDPNIVRKIPETLARNKRLVLYDVREGKGYLAMQDPQDPETVNAISRRLTMSIEPSFAMPRGITEALRHYQRDISEEFERMIREHVTRMDQENGEKNDGREVPVAKIVDSIITYAYQSRASDIHFEPLEESVALRFRVDGILNDILPIPKSVYVFIVARIKVMANMRTDEHQAAQDGRLKVDVGEEQLDVRVSVLPTVYGEKVVMRLLAQALRQFTIDDLGIRKDDLRRVRNAILRPHGMILVTGPTGCGKTTTLYGVLKALNTREVNITTVEDPVEYVLDGINQVQIKPQSGLGFASGLRSILRQDPDIIMVGEIRDEETAKIAVNAALTGHIVLSTLHTNDAATAPPRLIDMGVEPFLVSSSLSVVIAQRLVRKVCTHCMETRPFTPEQQAMVVDVLPKDSVLLEEIKKRSRITRGKGCSSCNGTGYTGRVGIYEILNVDEELQNLIAMRQPTDKIKHSARERGMTYMVEDGVEKALTGVTTIEEVVRVTRV